MCGILGAFSSSINSSKDFSDSLSRLDHRGPDSLGSIQLKSDPFSIYLGHTRLAITGLGAQGAQPMLSNSGRTVLIFNGEIYNYKEIRYQLLSKGCCFRTNTDTEVLANAYEVWGIDCLSRLEGMFAFAAYSKDSRELVVARDPFGIKPLYWTCPTIDSFIFGSEINPVLSLSKSRRVFNPSAIIEFILSGVYDIGNETFFEDINRLEPGHFMRITNSGSSLKLYSENWWNYDAFPDHSVSYAEAVHSFRELLDNSIALQGNADVPLAVALSGGIDSSVIAATLQRSSLKTLEAFHFLSNDASSSEEEFADLLCAKYSINLHKVILSKPSVQTIYDVIKVQEEPFISPSVIAQYHIYRSVSEHGFKVCLDGQGGDEMACGYNGYVSHRIRTFLESGTIYQIPEYLVNYFRNSNTSLSFLLANSILGLFTSNATEKFLKKQVLLYKIPQLFSSNAFKVNRMYHSPSLDLPGNRISQQIVNGTLGSLQSLLRHADRNSMFHGVESRVPFLSQALFRFLMTLPAEIISPVSGKTKSLLRDAYINILPQKISQRRDKIGFEPSRAYSHESISQIKDLALEGLRKIPSLDVSKAEAFLQLMCTTRPKRYNDVSNTSAWRLACVGIWSSINL